MSFRWIEILTRFAVDTYGGAVLLLFLNLLQVSMLLWVVRERRRMASESGVLVDEARVARAAERAGVWRARVRPVVLAITLVAPGTGLGLSTLLGALGMGSLGHLLSADVAPEVLRASLASGFTKVAYSYILMTLGTPPMVLGTVALTLAHRFQEEEEAVAKEDPEVLQLETQRRILACLERMGSPRELA